MHTDITKTDISLSGILEYKKSLESADGVSDEVAELIEIAETLLQGKVDKVARLRKGLEAHIEALDEQKKNVEWMLGRVNAFLEDVVTKAGGKLEGSAFNLRMQKNSQPALIIDDEAAIPDLYKKADISFSVPLTDTDVVLMFVGMKLNRVVSLKKDLTEEELAGSSILYKLDITPEERATLKHEFSVVSSKTDIKAALKNSVVIPGVRTEQGYHLRVAPVSAASVKKRLEG